MMKSAASVAAAVVAVFIWTASVAAQAPTSLVITFTEQPDSTDSNGVLISAILNGVQLSPGCLSAAANASFVCRNSNEFASVDFTVPGATVPTVTTQVRLLEPLPAPAGTVSDFFQFGPSTSSTAPFRVSFSSLPETGGLVPACSQTVGCLPDITESGVSQLVFTTTILGTVPLTLTVNALSDTGEATNAVPEPGTLLLLSSGVLLGLRIVRRRRARL